MNEAGQINWLDYTLQNNPQGVLKTLSRYGYIGMLAPQSIEEAKQCALEIMDQYEDEGTVALMEAHPEYPAFHELFTDPNYRPGKFHNAVNGIASKVDSFVSKLTPVNQFLVGIGVFIAVYYVLQETKK